MEDSRFLLIKAFLYGIKNIYSEAPRMSGVHLPQEPPGGQAGGSLTSLRKRPASLRHCRGALQAPSHRQFCKWFAIGKLGTCTAFIRKERGGAPSVMRKCCFSDSQVQRTNQRFSGERGKGEDEKGGGREKYSGIRHNMGIRPVFSSDCPWSVILKKRESLYYTLITYIILYNCTWIKIRLNRKKKIAAY